jgi:hypothetical protein
MQTADRAFVRSAGTSSWCSSKNGKLGAAAATSWHLSSATSYSRACLSVSTWKSAS